MSPIVRRAASPEEHAVLSVGWLKDRTGGYAAGMLVLAAALLGSGLLALATPRSSARPD